jgi:hypothetical protein
LAVIVVAGLFSRSGFGARLSAEATAAAYAGANDAIYRLIKGDVITSYDIILGNNRSATVQVTKDPACVLPSAFCSYTIISKGNAFLSNRKVEAVLSVDPLTRQIEVRSFKEIEVSAP